MLLFYSKNSHFVNRTKCYKSRNVLYLHPSNTLGYELFIMNTIKTDILILGAGIGGYETFRTLAAELKRKNIQKTITIVDQNNYFTFVPLLHEVAAGAVEPSQAAVSLRELLYRTPHKFLMASILRVLPAENKVLTTAGEVHYDYCVVSMGSGTNYYGIPGAEKFAYGIRSLVQAMDLRESIVEKLEGCDDAIHISIVGGGYTGVEVAGQIKHLMNDDIPKIYPDKKVTLRIIQTDKVLVPILPSKVQQLITARLTKMNVEILTDVAVKEVTEKSVVLSDGRTLPSDITIWCAGFKTDAAKFLPENITERGRMTTTSSLTSPAFPNLYGVGDIIAGRNVGSDKLYPQLGEAAHKQGEYVGRHIGAVLQGKILKPFFFKSFGTLMPIGDDYGIVLIGNFLIHGWLAWWIRRTVYVMFMPGFLRKLKIIINWTLRIFGFSYILEVKK